MGGDFIYIFELKFKDNSNISMYMLDISSIKALAFNQDEVFDLLIMGDIIVNKKLVNIDSNIYKSAVENSIISVN